MLAGKGCYLTARDSVIKNCCHLLCSMLSLPPQLRQRQFVLVLVSTTMYASFCHWSSLLICMRAVPFCACERFSQSCLEP